MEWMSKKIFIKSKDAKKVRHLATLLDGAGTKDEMRFVFDNLAIQTLKEASTHSEHWTPG